MRHRGYNNNVSANSNSVARKFKYNGIELEESLGVDLYEMPFRQYDPAIGRFTSIDPITHYSMSTYTAFDNNPIFFADPSGADSIYNFDTNQYVINGQVVSEQAAIAYAENGGNADGSNNNTANEGSESGSSTNSNTSTNVGVSSNASASASNNVGSSSDGDPCPNCPDKDLRQAAIMMANHAGGNAQDYYDAMVNDSFVGDRITENVINVANTATAGEAGAITTFFRSLFTKKIVITFGKNANQIYHTFRHIESAGFSRKAVQEAVTRSVNQSAKFIKKGQSFNKTITVGGKQIRYSAYKLPSGEINVGRIVIPK